ncbi:MAG: threonine synthase [Acidimicrobiia bacterium]|nr:MAG: threonine synthase [Acidimicrobiia bacterium]
MKYVSTRGEAPILSFDEVLLQGLASDGGLYVPERWPRLGRIPVEHGYPAVVCTVLEPLVGNGVVGSDLEALVAAAYRRFRHPEVAPLRPAGSGIGLLELYWGPTLSFKDYALQLVARMFDRVLGVRGMKMTVLGATSGDTGSAAIEAFRGLEAVNVVILYPEGRISDIQRRQMTTVSDLNVSAVAVEGTFDDCQALVKRAFSDPELSARYRLGAVNSINWGRVAVQAAYHWWAASLMGGPVDVVVPTGNFGNAFAGWVARRMGAPIARIVIGNNANHGLADLIHRGTIRSAPVVATVAPAMDIQVPSNLERYLFELWDRDPVRTRDAAARLAAGEEVVLDAAAHLRSSNEMAAHWVDDREIRRTIARLYSEKGLLVDPHTAAGWAALEQVGGPDPKVLVGTAHPAKFPEVVEEATGVRPALPDDLADLQRRPERIRRIGPGIDQLRQVLEDLDTA